MADDLEARLESHAQAFEGLLSLIPANQYYAKDNSDQWQRKKQTKEQKRQAKRAKLDPSNQKSAKDVMDENERKRKRELGIESDDDNEDSTQVDLDVDTEQPGEPLRKSKKQKVDGEDQDADTARKAAAAEKRKEKRLQKKEKIDKQKAKLEAKKARKQQDQEPTADNDVGSDSEAEDDDNQSIQGAGEVEAMDISGLADENDASAPSSPEQDPVFDTPANQSATSSASSTVPATDSASTDIKPKKEKALKLPEVNSEELQARLKARIEQLRAQRKADGPNGAAPRNRQELLESRRKKEEARKQHKKELRLKAKAEEERLNNERLRGSGSPLSTDIFSPRPVDETTNSFSFSKIAFDNGEEADPDLSGIGAHKKKKGPQDTRTALLAAEKKAQRLAGYDDEKRAEIEEKDAWLNAKKRAHGERVRDDQSLLKKALKRKDKEKTKSATEWNERLDNVKKGKEMKDKKRDANLKKRSEEKKAARSGKKPKGGKKGGTKKGRPGFEGK